MAAAGQWIFWVSICLVAYTYLAYPALLWLFTFWKRPSVYEESENWPSMSLIISAYNESAVIADKLRNSLDLDYPTDLFQVVMVSDASDDSTDE
ncbi:uncharacterized protein METZ01_LOCUS431868, partial [marine metagenome]